MPLHMLTSLTIGVPDVGAARVYYREFGLADAGGGWLATRDGGRQLRFETAPFRRLLAMEMAVDDPDDIARISSRLDAIDVVAERDASSVTAPEPVTGVHVTARVTPRLTQAPVPAPVYNGPGAPARAGTRAPAILRSGRVVPRRLGHVVIGSPDPGVSQRFFTDGFGLEVSDQVRDAASFMRCSTDHHNVLVQRAPVTFLHHTSWQVDDVDEVGRGATAMLEGHPERHVWGLGRHHIGSNFFWYLRDPAGTFAEYCSDLDCVVDDELWDARVWEEDKGLYRWGPPPPPSFVNPEDLAARMTGAHTAG
ncbi:dioxygenase [Streptomyces sulfonofaciens]|uniref:Dioxygenase n=1 Tax=Streptomyces sulfonofaciens TaxID=68272 RepID=A0A919L850_9ACTN|nr:VOC family protein [Streptomyces sulfonofaciens]GHH87433.1 dioxygenase [Streptomyces sulfonofaciens]